VEIVSPGKVISLLRLEWILLTVWASADEKHPILLVQYGNTNLETCYHSRTLAASKGRLSM